MTSEKDLDFEILDKNKKTKKLKELWIAFLYLIPGKGKKFERQRRNESPGNELQVLLDGDREWSLPS